MGLSASNALAQVQNSMVTNVNSNCTAGVSTLQTLACPPATFINCSYANVTCSENYSATISCTSAQAATSGQQAVANASSKAKAALGVAFSNSQTLTESSLETNLNTSCNITSDTQQTITNSGPIYCLNSNHISVKIIENADVNTRCQLSQIADAMQTAAASSSSDAEGWDPISDIMGPLSAAMKQVILAVIIIAVVALVGLVGISIVRGITGKKASYSQFQSQPQQFQQPPQQQQQQQRPPAYNYNYNYN